MQYKSLSKCNHMKGTNHFETTYKTENSMLCIVPIVNANFTFAEIKNLATFGSFVKIIRGICFNSLQNYPLDSR